MRTIIDEDSEPVRRPSDQPPDLQRGMSAGDILLPGLVRHERYYVAGAWPASAGSDAALIVAALESFRAGRARLHREVSVALIPAKAR